MFCIFCGTKLLYDSAKFCQNCGESCITSPAQTPLQTPFPAQVFPFMTMFGFGRWGDSSAATDPSGYGGDYGGYGGC